jgi:predicted Zn-dependent protease
MNKVFSLQTLKTILWVGTKLLLGSLKIILLLFFNKDLHKKIKESEEWENDYDEYTTQVTKRKIFY